MNQHAEKCSSAFLCILLVMSSGNAWSGDFESKKVHNATGNLPEFPKIDVANPDRFLNDLMLSPLWKVEKERSGSFIAKARSIGSESSFDKTGRQFLFELMATTNKSLPKDYQINDKYLEGDDIFSSFRITVVFKKPDLAFVNVGKSAQKATLSVYESYETKISPNSFSDLGIRLSSQHEIYVLLHEQGADTSRKTTFAKILPALRELADVAESPARYRVEERYADFFKLFFKTPLKDQEIKRFPGLQDRDTFYGFFRAKPNTSYRGINIKISHPIYCPEEGTRKYERLDKAEYLGIPFYEGDLLFFLIEDNAVYLSEEYDKRFGTFSGKESFNGTLEVLNDKGATLLKTTAKFKGWER